MNKTLDLSWHREAAKRLKQRSAAIPNDEQLRGAYLNLAPRTIGWPSF